MQIDEIGWVYFGKKPSVNQLINEIIQDKAHLGLKSEDALKTKGGTDLNLFGSNPQLTNKSPLRIKQTHNGWEVEGADVSIHFDGSHNVELMHGKVVKNLPSGGSVSLNEKTALMRMHGRRLLTLQHGGLGFALIKSLKLPMRGTQWEWEILRQHVL